MRILVTNDDGIHAPGLAVAERIARALSNDVWIIAPESDQSGVSHSLSLNDPLRIREIGPKHIAVKGTPTDCVIMGVRHLMRDKGPDLVISGVNRGGNLAEDVTYSGTVAGAIEGTILGVPSFALSQIYGPETRQNLHWATAETYAPDLIRRILAHGLAPGVFINVNFPDCPPAEVAGVSVATQGFRAQDLLKIDARHDGRGLPYYWIAFQRYEPKRADGTDLWAVHGRRIAVTPLRLDMTDEPFMTQLARLFA